MPFLTALQSGQIPTDWFNRLWRWSHLIHTRWHNTLLLPFVYPQTSSATAGRLSLCVWQTHVLTKSLSVFVYTCMSVCTSVCVCGWGEGWGGGGGWRVCMQVCQFGQHEFYKITVEFSLAACDFNRCFVLSPFIVGGFRLILFGNI